MRMKMLDLKDLLQEKTLEMLFAISDNWNQLLDGKARSQIQNGYIK